MQQGQVFELKRRAVDGSAVWAYRYRTGGPGSRRLQRGGFASERDAAEALERALERLRRQNGVGSTLTLEELVDEYLAQHDAEPETIEKLRWLLAKARARVRRPPPRRASPAGDRGLADDDPARPPLRGDPGAAAGARARGRLGNDRRQPGQARRREPAAAAHREAPVRVMGATRASSPPGSGRVTGRW